MKPKLRTPMSPKQFKQAVKAHTKIVYKTRGEQCPDCKAAKVDITLSRKTAP